MNKFMYEKISPVTFLLVHVADGVDVDQETNAGDDQEHNQRKLIENKAEIDVQRAGGYPVAIRFNVGQNIRLQCEFKSTQHDEQRSQGRQQRNRRNN